MHSAKILADSISPDGVRLTTFEATFPRIVLAEWNTHRAFSRNSASSRAIPVKKMIQMVKEKPYIPTSWGKNQKGMQADEEVSGEQAQQARSQWLHSRDLAVGGAEALLARGIHKQLTNRLLEPYMLHTVICTATEWDNFWHLRCHPDAHPEIRKVAELMRELYEENTPESIPYGGWHLPLLTPEDSDWMKDAYEEEMIKVSVGRCCRVSYLTHDGVRDPEKDIELHDRLLESGHMSPFEHVATPASKVKDGEWHDTMLASPSNVDREHCVQAEHQWYGNFRGWVQYRKTIPNEHDILGSR